MSTPTGIIAPTTMRNSRVLTGIMFLLGLAFLLMAPLMGMIVLGELISFKHFGMDSVTMHKTYSILVWLVAAVSAASGGWGIMRSMINMLHNQAVIDASGVRLTIYSGKSRFDELIPWGQIVAVQQKKASNTVAYIVETAGGRLIQFTGYTFWSAKKLATLISSYSGRPLQRA